MLKEIKHRVRRAYFERDYPECGLFVEHFKRTFGDALLAVILYGSRMNLSTATKTSFLDFYLIADTYGSFHKKWLFRRINSLLPPAIFYLELKDEKGAGIPCKYCVISLEDLEHHTSYRAKDLYHLGRFSKRIAILYSAGDWVADNIVDYCTNAMQVLAPHAMAATSATFTVEDFAKSLLSLSYRGEIRLEQTDEKVSALYEAEKDFYDGVYEGILTNYIQTHRHEFKVSEPGEDGIYMQRRTLTGLAGMQKQLDKLLAKSRRRAKARWPLQMITVKGWVDILLAKIERTYGVKLDLTPTERRWVLIFGWKYYFRLRKEGKVK